MCTIQYSAPKNYIDDYLIQIMVDGIDVIIDSFEDRKENILNWVLK